MEKNKIIRPPSKKEMVTLRILIIFGILSIANFFYWFIKPELIDNKLLFGLLLGPLVFDSFRILYIWYHYWDISVPKKPTLTKKFTVDVFTTYFPGEPYQMVKETLLAIQRMKYPHTTYLCDEGNDAHLKEFCKKHEIVHVIRNNRINAKAGNINNALKQATGDICLILDPDHVPKENFLEEIVPYFEDDNIGFVQTVQAYYNFDESLVARGAAEQTFHFYGPVMMTMNSYGTVNAIGANCLFRRNALDSIGGHAPGLSEDMHTAMQLYAKGWKSVYVPEIFTKGLVPASLTSYYKQQLKWSRGTLELLVTVLPQLFNKFTWRQRIHFGILPLHYLSGFIILISFLIPIISLFAATTPWKGNVINFGLLFFPVLTCILGIRFYVQRWVMDKCERGTHIIGGLLLACTWWIYIIGFVYTIVRKKVPYLPTPKDDRDITSWKILIPNLIVGVISIIAVVYGLSKDFTPFSVFMSGFALINVSIMIFTLYLAYEKQKPVEVELNFKTGNNSILNTAHDLAYATWHKAALPLVFFILILCGSFYYQTDYVKWGGVEPEIQKKNVINYIGIFAPQNDDGISSLVNVNEVSSRIEENFDIISLYISWDKDVQSNFSRSLLDSIYSQKSIPMITWEPWLNTFYDEIEDNEDVYELIARGFFDNFIFRFSENLKNLQRPVFLRFAHEFDNPFYPWYITGENATEKFKKAWKHTYEIFKSNDANNVIWIWNPWKPENVISFYPGIEYVDWIGVNILNYGEFNQDGQWHNFNSLYEPFHDELINLPPTPVIISEFGTLKDGQQQNEWIEDAFTSIENDFKEIKSVIYFNSKVDKNWPIGLQRSEYLDWSIPENQVIKTSFKSKEVPGYVFTFLPILSENTNQKDSILLVPENVKGINLKQGQDWRKNYHVMNRRKLDADFERIKKLGLNTIKFTGNTVYNYNILNLSKEHELDVSFGFWIPESVDFIADTLETKRLTKSILKNVKKYKGHHHISSWNIQNDVLFNQKNFFHKPVLLFQNNAYIIWLKNLVNEIQKIDPDRPIMVDLEVNLLSIYHVQLLKDNISQLSCFGLIVKDDEHLISLMNHLEQSNTAYIFSEINVEILTYPEILNTKPSFFVTNWQDQHESNNLSFDGITDRKGRYKTDYYILQNVLQPADSIIEKQIVRILTPSVLLYENLVLEYYSIFYDENEGWKYGLDNMNYDFEWSMIKCDKYGNYLAIKDIDTGPVLRLKIPKNHEYFKLLFTVYDGKSITSTITTLNTPLIQNENNFR